MPVCRDPRPGRRDHFKSDFFNGIGRVPSVNPVAGEAAIVQFALDRGKRNRLRSERKAAVRVEWFAAVVGARWEGAVGIEEATMQTTIPTFVGYAKAPWNKGRLIGQKRPLKPKDVWAIRVRLQLEDRKCDLALFNLAIDSKLRGCDLVSPKVEDVCNSGRPRERATVIQQKTGRPIQFEITEQTRSSIRDWLSEADPKSRRYLLPSRVRSQPHLSTRQYARIVHGWIESAGLDSSAYGTHSMRRTKAAQIYRKTDNLRAVQLLLGHTKLESTVRYLGIEVDDALSIAEQIEL